MPLLTKRRAFLPICLTLGTLLCALPVLAEVPAVPASPAVQAKTLALQNVVPRDILKALHWNPTTQRFDSAAPIRVEGVTRISAMPTTNSLSVVATPDGFAKLRDLVRVLDVAQRQVQIKFAFVRTTPVALEASGINFTLVPLGGLQLTQTSSHAAVANAVPPSGFLGYADGNRAAQLLQTLQKQGLVLQSPTVTTTNNVAASLNIMGGQPVSALPGVASFTFAVTPRINSDDTVTLALHPQVTLRVVGQTNPDGTPATAMQDLQTLRTVRSGDTLVLTNVFPGAAGTKGEQLLLFVTPTIMPGESGPATPVK